MTGSVRTASSVFAAALWRDAFHKTATVFHSFPLDALDAVTDGALEKSGVNVWMYHQADLRDEAIDFLPRMTDDDAAVSRYFQNTYGNAAFAVDETDPGRVMLAFQKFEKPKEYVGFTIETKKLGALLVAAYDRARADASAARLRPGRGVAPDGLLGLMEHNAAENVKLLERVTGWSPDTAQAARVNVRDVTDFGAIVPDMMPDMTLDAARAAGHVFDSRIQRGPDLRSPSPN